MQNVKKIAQTAIASVIALSTMGANDPATTDSAKTKDNYVKCYGVAAASKNDCGTIVSACSATVKVDRACYAWVYVPEGICKKLAGASVGKPDAACKNPDGSPIK